MVLFRKRERILRTYAISKTYNMTELNKHPRTVFLYSRSRRKREGTVLNIMMTAYKIFDFIVAKFFHVSG